MTIIERRPKLNRFFECKLTPQQAFVFEMVEKRDLQALKTPVRFHLTCNDVNCFNNKRQTPLIIAVMNGDVEIVKFLLMKGAECKLKGPGSKIALEFAEDNDDPEVINLILFLDFLI